ncbi:MAG: hypothetical protein IJG39_01235 [Synergistaceae bacterium]|nr:hypothetical protein [Synergistaceae bacterium]
MKYTLGIDTGTTSVSIAVLNESRQVIDSITVNHEAFIPGDFPESRVQSPERIREIVMASLESLTRKYGQPSAIGFTGQMHGILYVNSKGESVSPLYTWQDISGSVPVNGKSSLEILREHGLTVSPGYGLATHFYLQRSGKIPNDGEKFTTISDYIAMKICGNDSPVLSAEMAAGLGCFDVQKREFMIDALKSAGVDVSFLPETVKGYSVIGHTESGASVVCSMGDNQASFMGSVDDPENTLLLNIGTGSQVSFMTREYVDVHSDIELRPYGDAYLLAGSALCGGRAYAMLEEFYREIAGHSCYDVMAEHAGKFLEAHGLGKAWEVDTRFQGTRSNPDITGSIRGITAENFCPGAFTVGVIRGILEELRGMYEGMKAMTGRSASVIVGSGNGIRKNEIMRRVAGEIFGLEVRVSESKEEAAKGSAMCAMNTVMKRG